RSPSDATTRARVAWSGSEPRMLVIASIAEISSCSLSKSVGTATYGRVRWGFIDCGPRVPALSTRDSACRLRQQGRLRPAKPCECDGSRAPCHARAHWWPTVDAVRHEP